MMKLAIYGAGGQGRVLARFALEINEEREYWDEVFFVDDVIPERSVLGLRVCPFAEIPERIGRDDMEFVISLGEPVHRRLLFERVEKAGYTLSQPIYRNQDDAKYNVFGRGVVVSGHVSVSNNARIGDNTYIGNGSIIGHDVVIGEHSFIAGAVIGGKSAIGGGSFIGLNATIADHVSIGSNVIVSAGACVLKDLPDGVKVIGNPAQVVPNFAGHKIFD